MTTKTVALNRDLSDLLELVNSGKAVLPEFQRDFDWGDSDVRSLLATVLVGWPIGSLLLMEGPPEFFETRSVDQAPPQSPPVDDVILDGQQRITSLYQALYDRGAYVYYLDTGALSEREIDDVEEAIISARREAFASRYPTPASQAEAGVIPISALRTATDFFIWRDAAIRGDDASAQEQRDSLTALFRDFLSGLHNYSVPAIMISKKISPAAIARIFERVNKTGMQLGTFDLMVAKSYSKTFNLRDKWREAKEERPRLAAFFGDDGLPLLSLIALRAHSDVRQKAVLGLTGASIRDGWNEACSRMDTALRFAVDELGVWGPGLIPYRSAISVIAGVSYDLDIFAERDLLRTWYWSTVFGRRYDVASNTRSVADYRDLVAGAWSPPRIYIAYEDAMVATNKSQGSFHRAVLNYVASLGPSDPVDGARLSPAELAEGVAAQVTPTSLIARGEDAADPPLHLRSLGFVLTASANRRRVGSQLETLDRQALRSQMVDPDSPEWLELLDHRLAELVESLTTRDGVSAVVVVDEDDDISAR